MTTKATTPPQTIDDPWCHCGYRKSLHGKLRQACGLFSYSIFFNEITIDEEWLHSAKQLKAKAAKASATARR